MRILNNSMNDDPNPQRSRAFSLSLSCPHPVESDSHTLWLRNTELCAQTRKSSKFAEEFMEKLNENANINENNGKTKSAKRISQFTIHCSFSSFGLSAQKMFEGSVRAYVYAHFIFGVSKEIKQKNKKTPNKSSVHILCTIVAGEKNVRVWQNREKSRITTQKQFEQRELHWAPSMSIVRKIFIVFPFFGEEESERTAHSIVIVE